MPSVSTSLRSLSGSSGHWHTAHVVDVVRETASTVSVVFATATPLAYRPGQHVNVLLRLGTGLYRRAYSLSSVPSDDLPRFTVKLVPGGKVSQYLTTQLAIGDRFQVSGARGEFVLPDSRAGRRFVFVAGGSGITPVMSLLRTLLAMPGPVAVALVYYTRNGDDIIFRDALERLDALHRHFRLSIVVTGPRAGWTGLHESFDIARVLAAADGDASALFYACGPDALVEEVAQGLSAADIPAANLCVERFSVEPQRERPAQGHPVTFLHRGLLFARRTRLRTRPGESLLDAAERAGLRVRSNCRNGSCGSCRARLLRGDVSQDEPNALSLTDAQAGRVLTCVARPDSPVVIDLR